ncbi:MAG: 50S ribosomal protein L22 [Candidatus Niyogibacteria bacterium CG10_big_fil_rev_8_21_14_0_10_42_19]|uniref:Large ribosomal subunit protein uL22 n=1 Tax=Candidatus Niyogibacteria bacterium CG10_big_fil_rev_8_21_14_0_10_42_19 TaxID=1974725 RepID=A0A2H0TFB3_9BACT|nr:MAG: 50S ribosomal protein L22 [Candidatus Niyogibacteria bacterium CG10_big_fil_rev_8_21_14_0_10_42_19]
MPNIKAYLKYLRMSPRKVRVVADTVRNKKVSNARVSLKFLPKKAAGPVGKLLASAVANAKHNFNLSDEDLYIKEIKVDQGPVLKRWMPRAFGRASAIRKRTSHVTIILDEAPKIPLKEKKEKEPVKKEKASKKNN